MKATIIHRWGGTPESDWIPWLKKELKSRGYNVNTPAMPGTEHPKINAWVNYFKKQNPEDLIIAHSIGCQTVLRYLEKEKTTKINKIIFILHGFILQILSLMKIHKAQQSPGLKHQLIMKK